MPESVIIMVHLIGLKRLALPLITQNQTVRQIKEGILPWIVWGVACLFYFHQYFLRVSVSGMELSLEQNLHLTATMLSNVTAPFLMTKYSISNSTANIGIAFMFIGLGVGGPVIGWFSNLINRYVLTMMIGSTASLLL